MNTKTYHMEVSPPWADFIFSGKKKIEMRKNDPSKWGRCCVGDYLIINKKGSADTIRFRVANIRTYPTLHDAFISEGVQNLLPGLSTEQEGLDVYLGFDGSSDDMKAKRLEEFAKFGTIVIELTRY